MKRPPKPRQKIYNLYWYFASERQRIFEKRIAGQAAPWTGDSILQTYKFCNVFRAADRVSQYMIRNVCYHNEPASRRTPADRLFQIVAFRTFSKIETWQAVHEFLGHYPTLNDLANDGFIKALEYAKSKNNTLYTNAFILAPGKPTATHFSSLEGPSFQKSKCLTHVELFRYMFLVNDLAGELLAAPSLKAVYDLLHGYPLMGDFMSYQTAIDLNYSDLINFDEDDFVQPGPGALRGIKKCFENLGDYTAAEVIMWMVKNQGKEFKRLGLPFNGLFGRPLHAIDCQGLFCETDKYTRVAVPNLGSARKRIKTRFSQSNDQLNLFFPPKWKLDI